MRKARKTRRTGSIISGLTGTVHLTRRVYCVHGLIKAKVLWTVDAGIGFAACHQIFCSLFTRQERRCCWQGDVSIFPAARNYGVTVMMHQGVLCIPVHEAFLLQTAIMFIRAVTTATFTVSTLILTNLFGIRISGLISVAVNFMGHNPVSSGLWRIQLLCYPRHPMLVLLPIINLQVMLYGKHAIL